MASLDGLPPLPKSLSGLNLVDFAAFQATSSPYSDRSASSGENNFSRSLSYSSNNPEARNFVSSAGRAFALSSDNIVLGKGKMAPGPGSREPSCLSLKQQPSADVSPIASNRGSPVVVPPRSTPHGSARGSPSMTRGSTPTGPQGTPSSSLRNLSRFSPPPRSVVPINGTEVPCLLPSRPGRLFNLDTQLATLRKEMFSLRQMDLSLLNQLWSLNEAIQDFRRLQEESAALFPPSPGSCEDSDEFYSPVSARGYSNISNFRLPQFSGRLSSASSESSIEFGDV